MKTIAVEPKSFTLPMKGEVVITGIQNVHLSGLTFAEPSSESPYLTITTEKEDGSTHIVQGSVADLGQGVFSAVKLSLKPHLSRLAGKDTFDDYLVNLNTMSNHISVVPSRFAEEKLSGTDLTFLPKGVFNYGQDFKKRGTILGVTVRQIIAGEAVSLTLDDNDLLWQGLMVAVAEALGTKILA